MTSNPINNPSKQDHNNSSPSKSGMGAEIDKILWKLYGRGYTVGRHPEANELPTAVEMVNLALAQITDQINNELEQMK